MASLRHLSAKLKTGTNKYEFEFPNELILLDIKQIYWDIKESGVACFLTNKKLDYQNLKIILTFVKFPSFYESEQSDANITITIITN